jgi:hypothetical protein
MDILHLPFSISKKKIPNLLILTSNVTEYVNIHIMSLEVKSRVARTLSHHHP